MRVAMVAGEASGDLLAAQLLAAMQIQWPQLHAFGIGGSQMAARGLDRFAASDQLAVFGYVEALKKLPQLLKLRRDFRNHCLSRDHRTDVFISVDAPDFNLGLSQSLKAQGIPTVHMVCPSFWAWRTERVKTLAQSTDHVLCLFPFEPALLAAHGVAATFIGHPLAQMIPEVPDRAAARALLGLAQGDAVVAVLPGSRAGEIKHIAPVFLQTVQWLLQQRPHLKFVLPVATGRMAALSDMVRLAGLQDHIQLLDGQSHTALAACDVTLIASGTATLEAALFKRPMVIGYKVGRLSYTLLKHKQLQPWVGLPNILSREFIAPELLQDAATPDALGQAVLAWLDDAPRVDRFVAQCTQLHRSLRQDTARLALTAIGQLLERRA